MTSDFQVGTQVGQAESEFTKGLCSKVSDQGW